MNRSDTIDALEKIRSIFLSVHDLEIKKITINDWEGVSTDTPDFHLGYAIAYSVAAAHIKSLLEDIENSW